MIDSLLLRIPEWAAVNLAYFFISNKKEKYISVTSVYGFSEKMLNILIGNMNLQFLFE